MSDGDAEVNDPMIVFSPNIACFPEGVVSIDNLTEFYKRGS